MASCGKPSASASRDRAPSPLANSFVQRPLRVAFDVLEQHRRAFFLQHAARHRADLAVPIDFGLDAAQLAMLLELRHPLPHIQKAHSVLTFAFAAAGHRRA